MSFRWQGEAPWGTNTKPNHKRKPSHTVWDNQQSRHWLVSYRGWGGSVGAKLCLVKDIWVQLGGFVCTFYLNNVSPKSGSAVRKGQNPQLRWHFNTCDCIPNACGFKQHPRPQLLELQLSAQPLPRPNHKATFHGEGKMWAPLHCGKTIAHSTS